VVKNTKEQCYQRKHPAFRRGTNPLPFLWLL